MLSALLGSIIEPVSTFFTTKQKRKQAAETAKAKIALAKQNDAHEIALKKDEWESISKNNEQNSWKDEYVTILVTSPFICLFIAAIASSYTGELKYIDAVTAGLDALQRLGVNLGELMMIVVLAAVSIKGINFLKK